MLDQVLCHPQLTNLKGLALEVDTKPAEMIVDEFAVFSRRYASLFRESRDSEKSIPPYEGKAALESAMKGHVLAEAVLMGTYQKD